MSQLFVRSVMVVVGLAVTVHCASAGDLVLNLRPLKGEKSLESPTVIEIELTNRTNEVIAVDVRGIGRSGRIEQIDLDPGEFPKIRGWTRSGEVKGQDPWVLLEPGERYSTSTTLQQLLGSRVADGRYIVTLEYSNHMEGTVNDAPRFVGRIESDSVVITVVDGSAEGPVSDHVRREGP